MKKYKVSIIVSCYNQAQYLDECLQSVLEQTYADWECIIVNDGSPDNTEEVAKKWVLKDKRFKYLYKENGGVSSARNAGISIAESEWVLPLDADNKLNSKYLELAEKCFDEGCTIIYSEAMLFGVKNGLWKLPKFDYKQFLLSNCIDTLAFFKKELWEKCGGYDENMSDGLEDWEFWIHILSMEKKPKVYKMDYVGFYYRVKKNSRNTALNNSEEKLHKAYNYVYQKHQKLYERFFEPFQIIKQQNNYYEVNINRNFLTKILFKIIRVTNKFFTKIGK